MSLHLTNKYRTTLRRVLTQLRAKEEECSRLHEELQGGGQRPVPPPGPAGTPPSTPPGGSVSSPRTGRLRASARESRTSSPSVGASWAAHLEERVLAELANLKESMNKSGADLSLVVQSVAAEREQQTQVRAGLEDLEERIAVRVAAEVDAALNARLDMLVETHARHMAVTAPLAGQIASVAQQLEQLADVVMGTGERVDLIARLVDGQASCIDDLAAKPDVVVDLSGVESKLDELMARPVPEPAAAVEVDLSTVESKLDQLMARPAPEPAAAVEVDLSTVETKLDELMARPAPEPAAAVEVDLSGVESKLNELMARPAPEPMVVPEVDLSTVESKLDELMARPAPEPMVVPEVDLSRVESKLDELMARPVPEPAAAVEVDLSGLESKLDQLMARPVPEPAAAAEVDLSTVESKLDELMARPAPEPAAGVEIDLSGVEAKLDSLIAHSGPDLTHVNARLDELVAAFDLTGIHARLDDLVSVPVNERLNAVQDSLMAINESLERDSFIVDHVASTLRSLPLDESDLSTTLHASDVSADESDDDAPFVLHSAKSDESLPRDVPRVTFDSVDAVIAAFIENDPENVSSESIPFHVLVPLLVWVGSSPWDAKVDANDLLEDEDGGVASEEVSSLLSLTLQNVDGGLDQFLAKASDHFTQLRAKGKAANLLTERLSRRGPGRRRSSSISFSPEPAVIPPSETYEASATSKSSKVVKT
ncbi:uncharacterized protein AMSG_01355 [Thecamonas trahens ATCC 50062]|uniref:Uncharacterized protein n=1 Tax=Thecamonas trahens ATCC 50062 TaxID=461836 RepID=A0A0L0DN13_THETB|nr:hypothetical protein AMSG_01355 [Thecamonas trahens ATCC 50062]KNC53645.1 hypothetical protein AMSG_01355 [Thecamonas trahens ATCC 50062]|eukprot:XP_013761962.1 hypothetical protein AMSG_01355 [Thecamonas trahens ATCC 50062]